MENPDPLIERAVDKLLAIENSGGRALLTKHLIEKPTLVLGYLDLFGVRFCLGEVLKSGETVVFDTGKFMEVLKKRLGVTSSTTAETVPSPSQS